MILFLLITHCIWMEGPLRAATAEQIRSSSIFNNNDDDNPWFHRQLWDLSEQ